MNCQTFYTIPHLNRPLSDAICLHQLVPRPGQYNGVWVNLFRMKAILRHIYMCRTANMSWRMYVVLKQIQSNPMQSEASSYEDKSDSTWVLPDTPGCGLQTFFTLETPWSLLFALLCFVVVIHWPIFPNPSGLLHWHSGNLTIAPVPAKQPWWIWINTSCVFIMNDCITTTKQITTKPCAYFLGYTVC